MDHSNDDKNQKLDQNEIRIKYGCIEDEIWIENEVWIKNKMWIKNCLIMDQKDVDQKSITEDWISN